jgi:hypothetical protein
MPMKTSLVLLSAVHRHITGETATGLWYGKVNAFTGEVIRPEVTLWDAYFLAETMKYLYLVFSTDSDVTPDNHVFSTEAHPFKKGHYTAGKIRTGLGI